MSKITSFFVDAKGELLKVNWPNKSQIIQYTLVVIGISVALAVFLGGLDYLFAYLLKIFVLK